MSSQYKGNIFSPGNFPTSDTTTRNNIGKKAKPNIDHLIKKILVKRRQERRKVSVLWFTTLSIILTLVFFQN